MEKKWRYCSESYVKTVRRVFPKNMNTYGSLFGGEILSEMDDAASMAFSKHTGYGCMTAALDHLSFIRPIYPNHLMITEAFVSGVGRSSAEVFVKVTGEDLLKGERYLAASCFVTLVAQNEGPIELPAIAAETTEERLVCNDYGKRVAQRRQTKVQMTAIHSELKL